MNDERVPRFKMVNGQIKSWYVNRYTPTNKIPDFKNPTARKIIDAELGSMAYEVKQAERTKSILTEDEYGRFNGRVAGSSTFPKFMRESGISSRNDFIKVMESRKGIRFKRLESKAIDRLSKGFMDANNYSPPDEKFLVASKQVYDRKDVIFRRVRGRLIPMKVPKERRADLMEEAPF